MSINLRQTYLIDRFPWLSRLGARVPGERIEVACDRCSKAEAFGYEDSHRERRSHGAYSDFKSELRGDPKRASPILRGRPTYDRLPGSAEAYNKDFNDNLSVGSILLPEISTSFSSSEETYYRTRLPEEFKDRDYVTGSFMGAGSGAALDESLNPIEFGSLCYSIHLRSCEVFFGDARYRQGSSIPVETVSFKGAIVDLPRDFTGYIYLNGDGNLEIRQSLPKVDNNNPGGDYTLWCEEDDNLGLVHPDKKCVRLRKSFLEDEDNRYRDTLDVGDTSETIQLNPGNLKLTEDAPPGANPLGQEVAPLYKFVTYGDRITIWQDLRVFDKSFDLPIAKWLTDHGDNFLQEKKEQIELFFDDYLYPDTVGMDLIACEGHLRSTFKPSTVTKIIDAWDFGFVLDREGNLNPLFSFIGNNGVDELKNYDFQTHQRLDWLAQHFGFIDINAGVKSLKDYRQGNVWHNNSHYDRTFNKESSDSVYFTIAEKRAILRNAFAQDSFQKYDSDTKRFIFTRFPFSQYNRITPQTWGGLLLNKGTEDAIHFMFDLLGLHGYRNIRDGGIRDEDLLLDYRTPLKLESFRNKHLIDVIHQYDPDTNTLVPTIELNDNGYLKDGHEIDVSMFAENHLNSYYLRLPFSWNRNSQNWKRAEEVVAAYSRGNVILGYPYFIPGRSAIGECLFENDWNNDETNPDNKTLPLFEYGLINNVEFWGSSLSNYTYTLTSNFAEMSEDAQGLMYSFSRFSVKSNYAFISYLKSSPDPEADSIPVSLIREKFFSDYILDNDDYLYVTLAENYSLDLNLSPIGTNLLPILKCDRGNLQYFLPVNSESNFPHTGVSVIRKYGNGRYIIVSGNNDYAYSSNDGFKTLFPLALPPGVSVIQDIFFDDESRTIYLAGSAKVYGRVETNSTWSEILRFDLDSERDIKKAIINKNGENLYVTTISQDRLNYDSQMEVIYTPNNGIDSFRILQLPLANLYNPIFDIKYKVRSLLQSNLINPGQIEFLILTNYNLVARGYRQKEFIDISSKIKQKILDHLLERVALDGNRQDRARPLGDRVTKTSIRLRDELSIYSTNDNSLLNDIWSAENFPEVFEFKDVFFKFSDGKYHLMVVLRSNRAINSIAADRDVRLETMIVSFSQLDLADFQIIREAVFLPLSLEVNNVIDITIPEFLIPIEFSRPDLILDPI